jgi:hypothetical protein
MFISNSQFIELFLVSSSRSILQFSGTKKKKKKKKNEVDTNC